MNSSIKIRVVIFMIISMLSCKKEAGNTIRDIDGNVYTSVTIGSQVWMAENLRTTRYSNGDLIGTTTPDTLDITADTMPKYQWAYDGLESSVDPYGRLYTWFAATDIRGICPTGWHLPAMKEWVTLLYPYDIGSGNIIGADLMEAGTAHWQRTDITGTNETGFTAVPGGSRNLNGTFYGITQISRYWSSMESALTKYSIPYPIPITGNYMETPSHDLFLKGTGFSIRCIKDSI